MAKNKKKKVPKAKKPKKKPMSEELEDGSGADVEINTDADEAALIESELPKPTKKKKEDAPDDSKIWKCTRCNFTTRYPKEQGYHGAKDAKGKVINKTANAQCPTCFADLV